MQSLTSPVMVEEGGEGILALCYFEVPNMQYSMKNSSQHPMAVDDVSA